MTNSRGFASPVLILIFVVGMVLFGGWWVMQRSSVSPEPLDSVPVDQS